MLISTCTMFMLLMLNYNQTTLKSLWINFCWKIKILPLEFLVLLIFMVRQPRIISNTSIKTSYRRYYRIHSSWTWHLVHFPSGTLFFFQFPIFSLLNSSFIEQFRAKMSLKNFHVAWWCSENCYKRSKITSNSKIAYWPKMTFGCRTPTEPINIS